ncbi:MAG: hypothetical protein V9G98_14295 [Candidatus Competibacter sp.]
MDSYEGSFVTRCALQLAPLLFVRPGELRQAEWPEFDLEAAEWRIPAHKMKMRHAHIVPLARPIRGDPAGTARTHGQGVGTCSPACGPPPGP